MFYSPIFVSFINFENMKIVSLFVGITSFIFKPFSDVMSTRLILCDCRHFCYIFLIKCMQNVFSYKEETV